MKVKKCVFICDCNIPIAYIKLYINVFIIFSEELAAHSSNVNCLAFGRKSGRVMVTGGDDKKVNLWAVGKPNCIMVSIQNCTFLC